MDFYYGFVRLCNRKGLAPSAVALEIGLKKSAVTRWKNGGQPTDATLEKICDFFGVTKEYFSENEKAPTGYSERITPELRELMEICGDDPAILKELLDFAKFKKANR